MSVKLKGLWFSTYPGRHRNRPLTCLACDGTIPVGEKSYRLARRTVYTPREKFVQLGHLCGRCRKGLGPAKGGYYTQIGTEEQ